MLLSLICKLKLIIGVARENSMLWVQYNPSFLESTRGLGTRLHRQKYCVLFTNSVSKLRYYA